MSGDGGEQDIKGRRRPRNRGTQEARTLKEREDQDTKGQRRPGHRGERRPGHQGTEKVRISGDGGGQDTSVRRKQGY